MSQPVASSAAAGAAATAATTAASTAAATAAKQLASLKKKRTAIKSAVTRIETFTSNAMLDEIDDEIRFELAERRERLGEYNQEYADVQARIEDLDEREARDRDSFEKTYFSLRAKLTRLTRPAGGTASARPSPVPGSSGSEGSGGREPLTFVRLPKINLPTFSGKYEEWVTFHDTFNSLIHENEPLTDVQKFHYLRASLLDEAKNVIAALEVSGANYEGAWELLKDRYDDRRAIVYTHIRAILELPRMHRENAADLRRICDGVSRHIGALKALKRSADAWDDLLVYMLSEKLDNVTAEKWQASLRDTELPSLKQFKKFLTHRSVILETLARKEPSTAPRRSDTRAQTRSDGRRQALHATASRMSCTYCGGEHSVYACGAFGALSANQRIAEIRKKNLCLNCLRSSTHRAAQCPLAGCRSCSLKHNTLLHLPTRGTDGAIGGTSVAPAGSAGPSASSGEMTALLARETVGGSRAHVFLSTAIIHVIDNNNTRKPARVLLDSGSQANFVTKKFISTLNVNIQPANISISGMGRMTTRSSRVTKLKIRSRLNAFQQEMECIVTDVITERIPAVTVRRETIKLPPNIELADPQFNKASEIDMLIGAELFWQLICIGQIGATREHPTLQKTRLGWVLAGRLQSASGEIARAHALHATVTNADLYKKIEYFWRIEERSGAASSTLEERECEAHFEENVEIDATGRYIVKLPIKENAFRTIGNSRDIALKRLYNLERRLNQDAEFKSAYAKFMREYLTLGHMRPVASNEIERPGAIYLPHHGVFKQGDKTKKLRVVFDASCKTSTGASLNDALRKGPTVQQDLAAILIRFRAFAYVTSEKCAKEYPVGSRRIREDFYVDDLLTGADTLSETKRVREEIVEILRRGNFELSKWLSNRDELIPDRARGVRDEVAFGEEFEPKVLGIRWNPANDEFGFEANSGRGAERVTKRTILAEIASIFDPLGLLGPVIVVAKIIMQDTWQTQMGWEESVPQEIHQRWVDFRHELIYLKEIRVPRWVGSRDMHNLQLHGFCDASEKAYGACVYVRTREGPAKYKIVLLTSKSRVAPIKAISLPRLELCAAVLLAELTEKICASLNERKRSLFLWTDSTITLNWIASSSRRWNSFVANRVGEIQRATDIADWRHVPSAENPADLLSRGTTIQMLKTSPLWWNGPSFLQFESDSWPKRERAVISDEDLPERKKTIIASAGVIEEDIVQALLHRRSNLNKVQRVIAYCVRWRFKKEERPRTVQISPTEMRRALIIIVKSVQRRSFCEEYELLKNKIELRNTSAIRSLTPFYDDDGIIRVGGRIKRSAIPYDARHPMLLPRGHVLTTRVVQREHEKTLHAGIQATLAAVRQRFWPIAASLVVRGVVRRCVKCFRYRPTTSQAIMSDLPDKRVTVSRPFTHTGVDYAGPIFVKESKRRNARLTKAYIAVFICFTVKAVHLEIVSDLTSDAFLAAFKRFIARRGRPECVYSDNGTTFVGANKPLKELYEFVNSEREQKQIAEFLSEREINWRFIPPHAPHFGGLWEAAVKSTKTHMYRVVGNAHLTYEEMQTMLCEIEAILNSRPLTSLSTDPNDLECARGTAVEMATYRAAAAAFLEAMEFGVPPHVNAAVKMACSKTGAISVGQLVLIQQPGLGPLQWLLGRISEVHPGADGIVRAATMKTKGGYLTRPIVKLAILPIDEEDDK
ncbi:uncharacterized protein [Cardiocondyla obscurior]|uniref:uncharacterized protein n=1 Tax=Cardiocondyla obscurior TaxID=286306 RepID=UPI0039658651